MIAVLVAETTLVYASANMKNMTVRMMKSRAAGFAVNFIAGAIVHYKNMTGVNKNA